MDQEIFDRLVQYCEEKGGTKTAVIERALVEFFERNERNEEKADYVLDTGEIIEVQKKAEITVEDIERLSKYSAALLDLVKNKKDK